jgi:hypothetical protein
LRAFDCDVTGKRIMAWHWRRLALAASAAAAMGMVCAVSVEAQTPPKSAAKSKAAPKAAKQEEPAEQEQGEDAPAPKPKKAKQDPAQAQKTIAAAAKLLETGKASEAAQALTTVLSGGNLPPAIMAKALLYRGIAYRQQKLPAQAIADLTSALWLKGGLSEGDRADALRQRTAAYQEAGLADGGGEVAAVPNAARSATRTASADQGWSTATTNQGSAQSPAPAQSSSGWSLGNAFAGLFGGNSSPSTQTATPPPAAPETTASIEPARPPQAAEPSASRPRTSAWSRNTEVSPAVAAVPAAAAASAPAAKPEGRFRIQVGMVRSEGEAQALAGKVRSEHAAALASREPEVDQTVVGNMGSFYRVRVGPYSTQADGQAACAKLKGSGLDCMVVTQ